MGPTTIDDYYLAFICIKGNKFGGEKFYSLAFTTTEEGILD
jgi:hypothetical protein